MTIKQQVVALLYITFILHVKTYLKISYKRWNNNYMFNSYNISYNYCI